MRLTEAIRDRRATRDFRPDPVSAGLLYQLVSAAVWAPSAMNAQPWHFTIVTDPAVLDAIARRAKAWMLGSADQPAAGHAQTLLSDPQFQIFYHAPALIVISAPSGPWAQEDCALAAQNLMLTAASLGLGSCWIGFAQGWLNTPAGLEILNLPAGTDVVAPIIIGHPRTTPPPVPRKKPQVTWIGHYAPSEPALLETPGLYGALIHP